MTILGQLGNRVQHALRAFTPLDQKAVKVAAQTFRANPAFDTEEANTQLQTGEALLSFLDEKGAPSVVTRATILPPQSYMGAIDADLRKTFIDTSRFSGVYEEQIDRDSAYEYLAATMNLGRPASPAPKTAPVMPQAPAPVTVAAPSTTFMVFDPATNSYVAKQLDTMTPVPEAQPAAPQPVAAQPTVTQPAAPVQGPTMRQNVLVLDPATGQYIQKEMTMTLDTATGRYIPVTTEAEAQAAAKAARDAEAARVKQEKDAARAAKEADALERRKQADALRDERADRARRNDSILGRIKNTAINTATRNVVSELTRGLLGTLTGKK